jgi:hypothetical protein
MKIDRSNYEIWLIDWLDGNVTGNQVEQIKQFLAENPDLGEEFRDFTALNLKASSKSFPFKEQLKKSNADIPVSQFEYLCVANLENDLSAEQEDELKEIIDRDPEKKRTFEIFQKTILKPVAIGFKYKNRLIRRTSVNKVIRLSIIGLSTAAAIVLIVLNYFLIPQNLSDNVNDTAQNLMVDSNLKQVPAEKDLELIIAVNNKVPVREKTDNLPTAIHEERSVLTQTDILLAETVDSVPGSTEDKRTVIKKVPVNFTEINVTGEIFSNNLIASSTDLIIPPDEDQRSNLSKFISKTFREKILKENSSENSPLKGYEIAEAGVSGINKLLGWNMGLDRKTDENGDLKSVYFSSRILKFNAPVKKSTPQP